MSAALLSKWVLKEWRADFPYVSRRVCCDRLFLDCRSLLGHRGCFPHRSLDFGSSDASAGETLEDPLMPVFVVVN